MSAHLHQVITPGCYRCDLNLDEFAAAEQEQAERLAREAACPGHVWRERVTPFDSWAVCVHCGCEAAK